MSLSTGPQQGHQTFYEFRTYSIHPDQNAAFLKLTNEKIHLRTAHSELIGYWSVEYGALNRVFHIWKYGEDASLFFFCFFILRFEECKRTPAPVLFPPSSTSSLLLLLLREFLSAGRCSGRPGPGSLLDLRVHLQGDTNVDISGQ